MLNIQAALFRDEFGKAGMYSKGIFQVYSRTKLSSIRQNAFRRPTNRKMYLGEFVPKCLAFSAVIPILLSGLFDSIFSS